MARICNRIRTCVLYRRDGHRFSATSRPLGELAWDYLFTQPVSKDVRSRILRNPYLLNHAQVHLPRGLDKNYAWPERVQAGR
jgi:hypothetical protein